MVAQDSIVGTLRLGVEVRTAHGQDRLSGPVDAKFYRHLTLREGYWAPKLLAGNRQQLLRIPIISASSSGQRTPATVSRPTCNDGAADALDAGLTL